jgi:hypothetical protein
MGQAQRKSSSKMGQAHIEVEEAQAHLEIDMNQIQVQPDFRDSLIRELQSKNEALIWRNGFLESQLQEREQEIKLLTDKQHKLSRWVRFMNWFLRLES